MRLLRLRRPWIIVMPLSSLTVVSLLSIVERLLRTQRWRTRRRRRRHKSMWYAARLLLLLLLLRLLLWLSLGCSIVDICLVGVVLMLMCLSKGRLIRRWRLRHVAHAKGSLVRRR